jgi:3',5'-cyclic AMP phosphodiesterase CpdA
VQYADCEPVGARFYRESLGKLEACVEDFNRRDLAFVILVGDLIDRDFDSFDRALPVYEKLKAPGYHMLGNHDYAVTEGRLKDVPKRLGLKRRYYDFAHDSWRFVILDGNEISLYAHPKDGDAYRESEAIYDELVAREAPNAKPWNGGMRPEQLDWLRKTLKAASKAGERVIVLNHFPVFPLGDRHNLWNDAELMDVLDDFDCVVAYIAGHNHDGGYAISNSIHHLTLQGMVETQDSTAYAVVEVQPDRLKVIGIGREPTRILEIGPSIIASAT